MKPFRFSIHYPSIQIVTHHEAIVVVSDIFWQLLLQNSLRFSSTFSLLSQAHATSHDLKLTDEQPPLIDLLLIRNLPGNLARFWQKQKSRTCRLLITNLFQQLSLILIISLKVGRAKPIFNHVRFKAMFWLVIKIVIRKKKLWPIIGFTLKFLSYKQQQIR